MFNTVKTNEQNFEDMVYSHVRNGIYTYDYRTRRIIRDETEAGGVKTKLTFSGGLSVAEYNDNSSIPSVEYIRGSDYGGGIGGILYTLRGSGNNEASYTHANRRGDIVAKTDASGKATYQSTYQAFGTRNQENGTTSDRQKANSKDEDPTGLLNEGFRYRDLEASVFITADPAGMVDGPNLYTYVKQNPWTSFDPEGLNAVVVSGGINERSPTSAIGRLQLVARKLNVPILGRLAHDVNWRNFTEAAEANILTRQKSGDTQKIEWLVQRSTYENRAVNDGKVKDAYTNEITKFATDHNVELRWFNTGKELINHINNNSSGKARQETEKISDYAHYGHGYAGRMVTDYSGDAAHSISTNDITLISSNAFQTNSKSMLFPCNSARNDGQTSVRDVWEATTGSKTAGVVGRMNYGGKDGAKAPAPTEGTARWSWSKSVPPPKPAPHPTPAPEVKN